MTTKLTLSIEKETIERAKMVASQTGKSISKIVEEYLNSIVEQSAVNASQTEKLSGILKGAIPENTNWKKVKADYLKNKHAL